MRKEPWQLMPALGVAALLRGARIMELLPGAKDISISEGDGTKRIIVCWDGDPDVLLWIVLPHGLEISEHSYKEVLGLLAGHPNVGTRNVAMGPDLSLPQIGYNYGQHELVTVETYKSGFEWVCVEESYAYERGDEAAAASEEAGKARRGAFRELGRPPVPVSAS